MVIATFFKQYLLIHLQLKDRDAKHDTTAPRKRAGRVDCRPWPPSEEVRNPRSSGLFFYGIYLRENLQALEDYAVQVAPELAEADGNTKMMCGLFAAGDLIGDPSFNLDRIQLAAVRNRHKERMPCITHKKCAPVLYLFGYSKEEYEKRMSAQDVDKLVDALGCNPDWWEVAA